MDKNTSIIVAAWPGIDPRQVNKYTKLIYSDLCKNGIVVKSVTPKSIVAASGCEIFHYHWPETYCNKSWLVSLFGCWAVILNLVINKVLNIRNIWTVHNLHPHDSSDSWFVAQFYKILLLLTDHFIFLTEISKKSAVDCYGVKEGKTSVIGHPLYTLEPEIFGDAKQVLDKYSIENDYLLIFGLVRRYKNIPETINEFVKSNIQTIDLLIVGDCSDLKLRDEILELSSSSQPGKSIKFFDSTISESDLQVLIKNSTGVLVPYDTGSSGVIYMCIVLGKSMLVIENDYIKEINATFNPRVIHAAKIKIDSIAIENFIYTQRDSRIGVGLPDVTSFNNQIVDAHSRLFKQISK